jgi:hypothetical protein
VEAAIVAEIFERYTAGQGARSIAHTLNCRHVPTPRAQQGRPNGWEIGTIRAIIARRLYRGEIVWNQSRKRDSWGQKRQQPRPAGEWIERSAPHLRIVSDELWHKAQRRRQERSTRTRAGTVTGRGGRPAKYLLSGLLKCLCGARYECIKKPFGETVYVCSGHRRKGPAICANAMTIPVEQLDAAVIHALETSALTDQFIDQILATLPAAPEDRSAALAAEAAELDQHLASLIDVAKTVGSHVPKLADEIRNISVRLADVRAQQQQHASLERPDRERLKLALTRRVTEWRQILARHTPQARMVVKQLTGGALTMLRNNGKPLWLVELDAPALCEGLEYKCMASPTGQRDELRRLRGRLPLAA